MADQTTPPVPTEGAGAEDRANRRKVREGLVVSVAMEKTVVVAVVERVRHRRYAKTVQRTKKVHAHDEANSVRVGDRVRVAETRPLSKTKRWRVVEVLERAR
jgi:small subunit ribosomal protein S17